MATASTGTMGIDIGSKNVRVAVMANNWPVTLSFDDGHRSLPAAVAFNGNRRLIGFDAQKAAMRDPRNAIDCTKIFIGRRFDDCRDERRKILTRLSNVNGNAAFYVVYRGESRFIRPEQIIAELIAYCVQFASKEIKVDVNSVVISVPAYFTDKQRNVMQTAASIAGLEHVQLINETSATAIAYAFNIKRPDVKRVIVGDFGARTLTIAVVEYDQLDIRIKSYAHERIGGDDFTEVLVEYLARDIKMNYNRDVLLDHKALKKLRVGCERAKAELSSNPKVTLNVEKLFDSFSYSSTITSDIFYSLTASLIEKAILCIDDALKVADCKKTHIEDLVFVGGASRMPLFRKLVEASFSKQINNRINVDEAVASGAIIYEAKQYGTPGGYCLHDICTRSYALFVDRGHSLYVPRFSPLNETYAFDLKFNTPKKVTIYEDDKEMSSVELVPGKGKCKHTISLHIDNDGNLLPFNNIRDQPGFGNKLVKSLKTPVYSEDEMDQMISDFELFQMPVEERKPSFSEPYDYSDLLYI